MTETDDQLKHRLFRDRVEASRGMDPGEKLLAGARLFDVVRHRMLAGIRSRHPDWSELQVDAEFRRQLKALRDLRDRGVYTPCGEP